MPFKKGQSGNPSGAWADKPFREALRMEYKALEQGDIAKHPVGSLRWNAQKLLMLGEIPAITAVADRLDGKPAQESTVTVNNKRDASDWTRDELVAFLHDARARGNGAAPADGRRT